MNILQYLKGTNDKSIYYNKHSKLIGYSDSDFTNDEKTRRFTGGCIFLIGNSPIPWKSLLQKNLKMPIFEAEFVVQKSI